MEDKLSDVVEVNTGRSLTKRKRKRKRKFEKSNLELLAEQYHEQHEKFIKSAKEELVNLGKHNFMERSQHAGHGLDSLKLDGGISLPDMLSLPFHKLEHETQSSVITSSAGIENIANVLNCHVKYQSSRATTVKLFWEEFVLPPNCSFLISDLGSIEILAQDEQKYDVLVIDPPWENISAKRSKSYNTLPTWKILQVPLHTFMNDGCLVFVWVTNKAKYLSFVKEELFPKWNIQYLTDWFWIKVTQLGEYVIDINSTHKRPYEVMVIGRFSPVSSAPAQDSKGVTSCDTASIPRELNERFYRHQAIVSVPGILHSWKPPLDGILQTLLSKDYQVLELFARNLNPNWTSWGNETIKFQNVKYFVKNETQE